LEKLRGVADSLPGLAIDLTAGLAGAFLPAPGSRSAASSLMSGDFEGAFHALGYNYVGFDSYGGPNGFGVMWKRATGFKIAILGKLFKSLYGDLSM